MKSPKPIPYTIIGIDPGTNVLGYALLRVEGKKANAIEMGVLKLGRLSSHQLKLKSIFERLQQLIDRFEPKEMAIEAPFFGKNPQSMLKLGRAQGVAMASAITKGVPITEYSPKKIKQSVCGNGNASKEQVAAMLKQILKVDLDGQYLDATDALATALCHFYQSTSILGGGKRHKGWEGFLNDNPDRLSK